MVAILFNINFELLLVITKVDVQMCVYVCRRWTDISLQKEECFMGGWYLFPSDDLSLLKFTSCLMYICSFNRDRLFSTHFIHETRFSLHFVFRPIAYIYSSGLFCQWCLKWCVALKVAGPYMGGTILEYFQNFTDFNDGTWWISNLKWRFITHKSQMFLDCGGTRTSLL